MTDIEGDPQAIEQLRQAIQVFRGRAAEVLNGIEGEIAPVEMALDEARRYWEWECEKRRDEITGCLAQAAMAAAQGGYVDCSPLRAALYEAENRLREVIEQQTAVRQTREVFMQVTQRYESFLSQQSSHMDTFLTARATSLEAFLATPAPGAASGVTLGHLMPSGLRTRPATPLMPPEFREGNLGGPERRG
jgi:hypothetical protein